MDKILIFVIGSAIPHAWTMLTFSYQIYYCVCVFVLVIFDMNSLVLLCCLCSGDVSIRGHSC